jgi:hypothetical protein
MVLNNNLSKECSCLCCDIDKKIYDMAKVELSKVSYGMTIPVDYFKFEALVEMKTILEYKQNCSPCYSDYTMPVLISLTRKLLNTTC